MRRYYDDEEAPHFWDAVLFELGKDPGRAFDAIAGLVGWALDDPYQGDLRAEGVRVLHSRPVVHEGVLYAYRIAYVLEEYGALRSGKSGLIVFITAEPYEPGDEVHQPARNVKNH